MGVAVSLNQIDKETSVTVRKTGGDLCQLESDELRFLPELLLVSLAVATSSCCSASN